MPGYRAGDGKRSSRAVPHGRDAGSAWLGVARDLLGDYHIDAAEIRPGRSKDGDRQSATVALTSPWLTVTSALEAVTRNPFAASQGPRSGVLSRSQRPA